MDKFMSMLIVIILLLVVWGLRQKVIWVWRQAKTRLPIVVWALLCLAVATIVVKSFSYLFGNIPWGMVGLIILTIAATVLLVWLFRRYGGRVRYAGQIVRRIRPGWLIVVLLLIGYGVLIYYKYPWDNLNELTETEIKEVLRKIKKNNCSSAIPDQSPSDIFKINVTGDCPVTVKMEPHQMIVWWGDTSKFRTGWYFEKRGVPVGKITHNKFRVFQTRNGVDRVTIKIHGYYDPDPQWYTRQ